VSQILFPKRQRLFPNNPFLRAVVLSAMVISVVDVVMFYVVWSGITQITPQFVIATIIITMIALTANLWYRVFRYGKDAIYSASS